MVYILQNLNQTQEKFDDLPNLQMVMFLVIWEVPGNYMGLSATWGCPNFRQSNNGESDDDSPMDLEVPYFQTDMDRKHRTWISEMIWGL